MEIPDTFSNTTIPLVEITFDTILLAVIIAVLGFFVVKILGLIIRRSLSRASRLPELVVEFLISFFSILLYVLLLLLILAILGADVSSMVLGLSAVIGLILGFGLQSTISNLAAGVWIAALRPIDKNEFVEVNGISGTVVSVGIMATELLKPDNTYVTIPNSLVWGSPVINSTRMETRRVDVTVGVAYGSDLDRAIRVATSLMEGHDLVLPTPAPSVVVTELADSSINLSMRAWTKTPDLWGVKFDLTKKIVRAFREADIEIPFPQMDIHLDSPQ